MMALPGKRNALRPLHELTVASGLKRVALDADLARSAEAHAARWYLLAAKSLDVSSVVLDLQRGERIGIERRISFATLGDGTIDTLSVRRVAHDAAAKAWVRFVGVGLRSLVARCGSREVGGTAARHGMACSRLRFVGLSFFLPFVKHDLDSTLTGGSNCASHRLFFFFA